MIYPCQLKPKSLKIYAFLLLLYTSVGKGNKDELPIISSNRPNTDNLGSNIKIEISTSLKDTKTVGNNFSPLLSVSNVEQKFILKTLKPKEESVVKHKRDLHENSIIENEDSTKDIHLMPKTLKQNEPDAYKHINPTKSLANVDMKIESTSVNVSGESQGAPGLTSEPQKTNYDLIRTGRLFPREKQQNIGSNRNQIEQSLGAIAKITVSKGNEVGPSSRHGREEENRKANPDIQDIITGIVKILHGKANGQSPHESMRPRPQPSRINNRGPPRISDLPPLEFDTPPSYIPTTMQHNRIPPPYPFDIPPSPPSTIPLPPQPSKPGSKLPTHPFIEGVPLTEQLVPENKPQPIEYDTISMSEPSGSPSTPVVVPVKNNTTVNKMDKHKTTTNNSGNKIGNKRVRPRPPNRVRPPNNSTKPGPPFMKPTFEIIRETTTEPITEVPLLNETKPQSFSKDSPTTSTQVVIQPTRTKATYKTSSTLIKQDPTELPILLPTITGIGEATAVLESSNPVIEPSKPQVGTPVLPATRFEARPGIVLDDPEYKPGVHKRPLSHTHRPIITAPPAGPFGEVFDVTVHAVQGGDPAQGKPVTIPANINGGTVSVITKPELGQDFVSIDGKRTYINLFGETATQGIAPTTTQPQSSTSHPVSTPKPGEVGFAHPVPPRRTYKKPAQPPVRIDTCIVGDDSTCDVAQQERCQTEDGVSSCHCRPGYNRKKHHDPCRRIISMSTSLRVDRLYDRKLEWSDRLKDPESEEFRELSYETSQAIASAMSMTPFSDDFINTQINSIYSGRNLETANSVIYVNLTIQLQENLDTLRPAVRHDIQKHLIRVIQRRNNNVGNSAVFVDNPPGSVLALEDLDECSSQDLHDCHPRAECTNTFGSFKCACQAGLRDPWIGNIHREGRQCESCPNEYCSNRGECLFEHGQQVCHCTGSFYGTQCEVDGEVLGVAVGASVAAAIIIILTLVCLCMWSRRWSREQKCAVGVGMGSPVFGFMANGPTVKTPNVGGPPYQISIEERLRWAQMADVMAHANHYAQAEPGGDMSRANYGTHGVYPNMGSHTLNSMGSLQLPAIAPPVPLPRLALAAKAHSLYGAHSQHGSVHHVLKTSIDATSSSEEEDRADLLGRHFSAPRPKSRASITNQSGIYYDVDLERAEMYGKQNIPLNTYTMNSQHQMRPFYR